MLYIIPTPIGNIEDITLRGLKCFRNLKYFMCEDTRTTKKLFSLYEIDYSEKDFFSLTSFTNQGKLNHYLNILKVEDVGLVSDAGTPGLSDPGKILIELCNEHEIEYSVLAGANALVPAVVAAGFDTSKFVYLGFLPKKKGRQTTFKKIIDSEYPTFFYESVHRIEKTLLELQNLGFKGKVCIAREISKLHEQIINGTIDEVVSQVQNGIIVLKGEFVVGCY